MQLMHLIYKFIEISISCKRKYVTIEIRSRFKELRRFQRIKKIKNKNQKIKEVF